MGMYSYERKEQCSRYELHMVQLTIPQAFLDLVTGILTLMVTISESWPNPVGKFLSHRG
jgi:hypothetical protein